MIKKARTGKYKEIMYESGEELAFLQWAFELVDQGIILSIERSDSFLLSDALINNYAMSLKTKSKPMQQILLHGHSYTPEFLIVWNMKKARDKFTWAISSSTKCEKPIIVQDINYKFVSYIEVKPVWDQNNMERLFKLNMKWMWQKWGIYVNLIKPQELFAKTFTPKEYLRTSTGRPRKLNWRPKNLHNFLKS